MTTCPRFVSSWNVLPQVHHTFQSDFSLEYSLLDFNRTILFKKEQKQVFYDPAERMQTNLSYNILLCDLYRIFDVE